MVSKFTKPIGVLLSAVLLVASSGAHADDTEIYIGSGGGSSGAPLVFFYIEYTPNLASTICTGVTDANFNTTTQTASSCPQAWPVRNYLAADDVTDTVIDQFELTRAALKRVLIALGGGIKVGLLMAHDNLASCQGGPTATKCSQGGYILKGLTPVTDQTAGFDPATATKTQIATELSTHPGKKALFQKLDAIVSLQGNLSHENQNKEIYFELFRYLTGQGIYNGHNGWVDYATDDTFNLGGFNSNGYYYKDQPTWYVCDGTPNACYSDAAWVNGIYTGTSRWLKASKQTQPNTWVYNFDFALADSTNNKYMWTYPLQWDTTIEANSNTTYTAALRNACEKVYVVNVVDGGGNNANDADTAIKASLANGGLGINVAGNDPGFEQMVQWLYNKDLADGSFGTAGDLLGTQNVTSYFIAKQNQQVDQAAQYGGTGFAIPLTANAQSVVDTISQIFKNIIDSSTTFTSAAIPVNVFNRSEVLDNAYIALFQPNANSAPGWVGNVKKLKMQIYVQCNLYDTVDPTKCIQSENRLRLIDTSGINAISDTTGRIIPEALTFWTNPSGYDLYDNLSTTNGENEVAGRDGRSVFRGGAGQRIPNMLSSANTAGVMNWTNTTDGRHLFTEPDNGNTLLPIEWSNIATLWPSIYNTSTDDNYDVTNYWPGTYASAGRTATLTNDWSAAKALFNQDPGVTTTAIKNYYNSSGGIEAVNGAEYRIEQLASNVLAFMRGYDVNDEDTDGNRLETRRWIFNDPLHSRPLPINYGARNGYTNDDPSTAVDETNPDIRIIVGSNEGYLRMIRNTKTDRSESGQEVWAFMPRETMKIQKQLMDNSTTSLPDHPYATDGAPTAFIRDYDGTIGTCNPAPTPPATCDDEVLVFFGLRRGGRAYYGLDITDPDQPKYLWKINNQTPGFSELAYTFGQPAVRQLKWGSNTKPLPVLIFGGGYDLNKDIDSPSALGTDDSMGRAIYIVNAETGDLIWKVTGNSADTSGAYQYHPDMDDSIPSEVTAVDSSGDGLVDRIYVGDTGGRVWRVDTPGTDVSAWHATMIMDLGRHTVPDTATSTTKLANDRRFFYAPDVVPTRDASGNYDAVVIGSGNREHPRQTATYDYMYMYKDRVVNGPLPTSGVSAVTPSLLGDVTNNCIQQVVKNGCTNPSLTYGWQLKLEGLGEKSLSSALTMRGAIYFSTYQPNTNTGTTRTSCAPNEGEGYLYTVGLWDAVAVINYDTTNTVRDPSTGKDVVLQKEDRKRKLDSPGIPSENVYVSFRDKATNNKVDCILASDLNCGKDLGAQQWSTYWFEKQK